jgi:hypothetical protein
MERAALQAIRRAKLQPLPRNIAVPTWPSAFILIMCNKITRREFAALLMAPLGASLLRSRQNDLGTVGITVDGNESHPHRRSAVYPVHLRFQNHHLADVFNETLWNDLDFPEISFWPAAAFIRAENLQRSRIFVQPNGPTTGIEAQYNHIRQCFNSKRPIGSEVSSRLKLI